MRKAAAWLVAAIGMVCSSGAFSQAYPVKQVKLVVPQAAGGATDVFARHLAQKLNLTWNQAVVVENRVEVDGMHWAKVVKSSGAMLD